MKKLAWVVLIILAGMWLGALAFAIDLGVMGQL